MIAQIFRWQVLETLVKAFDLKTFVEVGVKEGRTVAYLLEHCPELRAITVDPWIRMPDAVPEEGGETYQGWDFVKIEQEYYANVRPYRDRVTHLRKSSAEAVDLVDGGQDLIFIDAAHDYANAMDDIRLWRQRLRPGGILAGHDYQHRFPGVMRAVADSFNLIDIGVAQDSVWFTRIGAP